MSVAEAVLALEAGVPVAAAVPGVFEPEPAPEGEPVLYEFDADFQGKIVAMLLRDHAFGVRTDGLIDPTYFENETDGVLVRIVGDYFRTYKKAPEWGVLPTLLKSLVASKKLRIDTVQDIVARLKELKTVDISDRDYVVEQVATFAKNKAVENALMHSITALEKQDFGKIQELLTAALLVGENDDSGDYDYWGEIENRTKGRIDEAAGLVVKDGITTGVPELDAVLYHGGWGRKELSALMGAAKAGKSMGMGDFGKAASLAGYNVAYFTLEVSAKIIAERADANVSDTVISLLKANPKRVEDAVKRLSAKAGAFKVFEYATGTLTNSMIRRKLERWRARGIKFDLIIVDYADIMAPEKRLDEERLNSKAIWEGLRAIAFDENAAILTATQSNRTGAKAVTAKGTDVAEDYNKVRTADVFITINISDADRAAGEARLYFSEMRNSEGGFTLRIRQDRSKMVFISKVLGRE